MELLGEHLHVANTPKLPVPLLNPQYGSPTGKYFWGSPATPGRGDTHACQGDRRCFGLCAVVSLFLIK